MGKVYFNGHMDKSIKVIIMKIKNMEMVNLPMLMGLITKDNGFLAISKAQV